MELLLELLLLGDELGDVFLCCHVLLVDVLLMSDGLVLGKDFAFVGQVAGFQLVVILLVLVNNTSGFNSEFFVIGISLCKSIS